MQLWAVALLRRIRVTENNQAKKTGGGLGVKITIVVALAVAVVAVVYAKRHPGHKANAGEVVEASGTFAATGAAATGEGQGSPSLQASAGQENKALPRLVDLGADKCIPCKMMAPILERLRKEYAGKMDVQFIDVWKNPAAGREYDVQIIPTQIFFDASGKELFRHEGFFAKEDILAKWKELGIDLGSSAKAR
jgi:thioredoxin 1